MRGKRLAFCVMAAMGLSACNGKAHGILAILPATSSAGVSSTLPIAAAVSTAGQTLTGTVSTKMGPLSGATVVAKDAHTGKMLGGATVGSSGAFAVSLTEPASHGLLQVVASKGDVTLEALAVAPGVGKNQYVLTMESGTPGGLQLNLGTTLAAQTLGVKVAEVFLADTGNQQQGFTVLQEMTALAQSLAAEDTDGSLSTLQQAAFSDSEVQQSIRTFVSSANLDLLADFQSNTGPVFQPTDVRLAAQGIDISAPGVVLNSMDNTITITQDGRVETTPVAHQRLIDGQALAVDWIQNEFSSPTTAMSALNPADSVGQLPQNTSGGDGDGGSGFSEPAGPEPNNEHGLSISDVVLADSGLSIMGTKAPGSLAYTPDGQPITLTVKGQLSAEHPPKSEPGDYSGAGFPFAGLLQQTFGDTLPHRRILMDDSILLPLATNTEPSDSAVSVVLNPKDLIDLAMPVPHWITVVDGEASATADVRVVNSQLPSGLQPTISSATLVDSLSYQGVESKPGNSEGNSTGKSNGNSDHENNGLHLGQQKNASSSVLDDATSTESPDATTTEAPDASSSPRFLRVVGQNFPVSFYAQWAQINGERAYAHATWITTDSSRVSVLFVHLPDDFVSKGDGLNSLAYATPFGFQMISF